MKMKYDRQILLRFDTCFFFFELYYLIYIIILSRLIFGLLSVLSISILQSSVQNARRLRSILLRSMLYPENLCHRPLFGDLLCLLNASLLSQ